ncbi:MAG: hypothetical protein FJY88_07700 [Candidatus Eisenbacteria bacterium]|nr:hypothetical protein [Candidatus Eisenbacteria bacterium]
MNQHVLGLLEFPKVCQMVAERAHSARGRQGALALRPCVDRAAVEGELDCVRQMRDLWIAGYDPGPIEIGELEPLIARLFMEEDLLDPLEILELRRYLDLSSRVRRTLGRPEIEQRFPDVHRIAAQFEDHGQLVKRIDEVFDPSGEFLDTASPNLARIRQSLRDQRLEAGEALAALARRETSRPEESFVTLREGRYVLAVKAQDRAHLKGIVHGHSGSGQTLFLEPLQAIERNNAIAEMEAGEHEERVRILHELTGRLRDRAAEIRRGYAACGVLDLLRARAQLALDLDGRVPAFNDGDRLRLVAARHPLLAESERAGGAAVVPLDLELAGAARTMVLSGPNMGGKTVALKSVGLLAAMAQSGLMVPAGDGTDLPVVDGIYVDLGDEQSIEQETSTFAGHLRNIALAWSEATGRSLVLLDELGGGTDPDEGAALGRALLELLTDRGCLVLATTHLSGLKLLAHEHPRMGNAAMEFDPSTQRPTYRLCHGSPGRSRAFELAQKILPPGELVTRAESYRSRWAAKLDELLGDLERQKALLEEQESRVRIAEEELQAATRRREQQAERLKQRLHQLRQGRIEAGGRTVAEAENLLNEIRRMRVEAERTLQERGRIEAAEIKTAEEGLERVRSRLRSPRDPALRPLRRADLQPGRLAWSADLKSHVRIESEPEGNERVWIAHGTLRFLVDSSTLSEAPAGGPLISPTRGRDAVRGPESVAPVERQIDLRGRSVEEGTLEVERYIDRASLAGTPEVRIIHGKGTGKLKRAIEEFLAASPLVVSFRTGEPHEGGWGATIVSLRSTEV